MTLLRIFVLWIIGLLTIVPYSIYQLLFYAERDEYAFLIVVPLFWIFGFWGVVGPLVAVVRIRRLMNALESAGSMTEIRQAYERNDGEEIIVDLIATENHVPRFLARIGYRYVLRQLQARSSSV
jgi:hypothetical protein